MRSDGTDKLLIGIVGGVIVLVAVAFAFVVLQPKPTYGADDTAEGALRNYLLAISQDDTARAYTYLAASLRGRPDSLAEFERQVQDGRYQFNMGDTSRTWQLGEARTADEEAIVPVITTQYYANSLFGSNPTHSRNEFSLEQEAGTWKIVHANSYWYWLDCWERQKGCN